MVIGGAVDHMFDPLNITGEFTVISPDGERYTGNLLSGKRHQWGKCVAADGSGKLAPGAAWLGM